MQKFLILLDTEFQILVAIMIEEEDLDGALELIFVEVGVLEGGQFLGIVDELVVRDCSVLVQVYLVEAAGCEGGGY